MAKHSKQPLTDDDSNEGAAPPPADASDFLWGCAAIAAAIGRTQVQTYHLIRIGALDGAVRKLSHKTLVASRQALGRLPLRAPTTAKSE
jgi:hypothetical protein